MVSLKYIWNLENSLVSILKDKFFLIKMKVYVQLIYIMISLNQKNIIKNTFVYSRFDNIYSVQLRLVNN